MASSSGMYIAEGTFQAKRKEVTGLELKSFVTHLLLKILLDYWDH